MLRAALARPGCSHTEVHFVGVNAASVTPQLLLLEEPVQLVPTPDGPGPWEITVTPAANPGTEEEFPQIHETPTWRDSCAYF